MRIILELSKVFIAYLFTFGTLIVPLPLLWLAMWRLRFHEDANLIWIGGSLLTGPLFYISAILSFKLGRWFLREWGPGYDETNTP